MMNRKNVKWCGIAIMAVWLILLPRAGRAAGWQMAETEDFQFIYRDSCKHLLPRVIMNAEISLTALREIFHYTPTEKIIVVIRDTRDSGGGKATTFPANRVVVEISPSDIDYEFLRFDDQFRWLFSHELVHIVISDQTTFTERGLRMILGKVEPVVPEPLTIPYGYMTSFNRFTPGWHQEGIAVFMETWLNGGFGRALGNFDEMYFRTLTAEGKPFMPEKQVDFADDDTFLLGSTSYFYGGRFMTYLAHEYGVDKLLAWMQIPEGRTFDLHFRKKFRLVFGLELKEAWAHFYAAERAFQQRNIARLKKYPLTEPQTLCPPMGWVSPGHWDPATGELYFASLRPGYLGTIYGLKIKTGEFRRVHDLPTPNILNISVTAYDPVHGYFHYTTHNDHGYRDWWAVDVKTGKAHRLFKDVRTASLTISPADQSLWGLKVENGLLVLFYSAFPYQELKPVLKLEMDVLLSHLAISPDGKRLAATLHLNDGRQEVMVADLETMQQIGQFQYETVSADGSPERPAWSVDGKMLYWNAYTNGVSNVFRKKQDPAAKNGEVEAVTNVLSGIFHPTPLADGNLLAFLYTGEGFQPVMVKDAPVEGLAAIQYYGQAIIEKKPELEAWRLKPDAARQEEISETLQTEPYRPYLNLKYATHVPVIQAFQHDLAIGVFNQFVDPLWYHRITLNAAVTPEDEKFHWLISYEYQDIWKLQLRRSPTSLYDLVNRRKINQPGWNGLVEYKKWWQYDRPYTLEQWFFGNWIRGYEPGHEQVESSVPEDLGDVFEFGTRITAQALRKSIGSVEDEHGFEWTLQMSNVRADMKELETDFAYGTYGSFLRPWITPHNILRISGAVGQAFGSTAESHFHFGGFGNRILEDNKVSARYREPASIPGISFRQQRAERFFKVGVENVLPPLELKIPVGDHYLKNAWLAVFGQHVWTWNPLGEEQFSSIGTQFNLKFGALYAFEPVVSLGYASAWNGAGHHHDELFVSVKLFR